MSPSKPGNTFDAKEAVEMEKNNPGHYRTLTSQQRLIVANYLNSIKYGYPENEFPKMDKTYFRMGRMDDEDDTN
ncbi:MAG: hypothetical protein JST32_05660 [Bacteroidetes bacterium]|nr:hypothetical protein [Bacteroidota bacterium]